MSNCPVAAVRRYLPVLALLFAFGLPGLALAQAQPPPSALGGLTLDELMALEVQSVTGASRFLQRVIDAPASVSIVTSEEIQRFGLRTLADILQGVRGFYVSSDRNYSFVGVRGFSRPGDYNTRVLLLVDGHRLNDNIYDQAPVGTEFPIDVDLIERVEIVRGPSSMLYGTNAFFAVVNVVTRGGRSLRGFSGAADVGGLWTRRMRGTFGGVLPRGGEFLLSATAYARDGQTDLRYPEYDDLPGGGRAAPSLDRDSFAQVFASATLGGWSGRAVYGAREKGIPTGAYGVTLDDSRSQTVDARVYGDVQYAGDWRGTAVTLRGAFDRYRYDGLYVYLSDSSRAVNDDRSRGVWWTGEASVRRRVANAHLLTAGLELRANVRQDQFSRFTPGDVTLDDRRDSRVWSLFAQDELTLSPRLIVNAGVGYDHFPEFGGTATFRGALIYKPRPDRALKLLYGTAFRAPNAYELYYYLPVSSPPHLEPETIRTAEVAWEQYFAGRVRVSATLFTSRVEDLISQVDAPDVSSGIDFANIDRVRASGLGVEAEGVVAARVEVLASYAYAISEDRMTGQRLSNSPAHMVKARGSFPVIGRSLVGGLEARYISARRTLSDGRTGAATVVRLTLTTREVRGFRMAVTADNLFDVRHADPGGEEHLQDVIPQDGRTALLRVSWRF